MVWFSRISALGITHFVLFYPFYYFNDLFMQNSSNLYSPNPYNAWPIFLRDSSYVLRGEGEATIYKNCIFNHLPQLLIFLLQ